MNWVLAIPLTAWAGVAIYAVKRWADVRMAQNATAAESVRGLRETTAALTAKAERLAAEARANLHPPSEPPTPRTEFGLRVIDGDKPQPDPAA